jgi:hypothetical protein
MSLGVVLEMNRIKTVLSLIMVAFAGIAQSAEFSRDEKAPRAIFLDGEIAAGDYAKLKRYIVNNYSTFPTVWTLASPGGDLYEAMMIGKDLRRAFAMTFSGKGCGSACVFLLVAGTERGAVGPVRMHRPFFDQTAFSNLSPDEAVKEYKKLLDGSRQYLVEMGMPTNLVDSMYTKGSDEVFEMQGMEWTEQVGKTDPAHYEIIRASCGRLNPKERQDWKKIESAEGEVERAVLFPSSPQIQEWATESKQILKMYSEGYRDYLRGLDEEESECEKEKFQEVRDRIYDEYRVEIRGSGEKPN